MTTTYERNLQALRTHHPPIAQFLERLPDAPAIGLGKNAAGEWELLCRFNETTARPYYGAASPTAEARALVEQLDFKNPRVVIFLGLGLGHHLLAYCQRPHPMNRVILVLEHFPHVFKRALEVNDFSTLFANPTIRWCVTPDLSVVRRFLSHVFLSWHVLCYANAVEYVPLPQAVALSPQYFDAVRKALPDVIGQQFNRYFGDPYDNFLGTQNTLRNLPALTQMPLLDGARGALQGIPGVVIASGPSLHEALPMLRAVQDRALFAACPSALPRLLRDGVAPQLWLNIERLENQGAFFETLPNYPLHLFVGPPLVHPRCWSGNRGHNVLTLGASLQALWLSLPGKMFELGHSSAHTAFLLLQFLGCNPIYLVGQDLCYDAGASHAEGIWEASRQAMLQLQEGKQFSVEGNSGVHVSANVFWYTYLRTLEDQLIPNYSGKVFNVIAATHGAKITGTTRLDPDQLPGVLGASHGDLVARLTSVLPAPSAADQEQRRKQFLRQLAGTRTMLQRTVQEGLAFARRSKELLFRPEFIPIQWAAAGPLYESFYQDAERYCSRFLNNGQVDPAYRLYLDFFHPIAQGMLLRYLIEFYTGADDLRGQYNEICRKTELMYHLAKDESHWAAQCLPLLDEAEAGLQRRDV
ncbi:MAG: DUF115 domain-containing protein [Deltaproteobacteria bacterium]|nr:DUF115 domain-containing protein [Deltaproteobacteria bacterium]